MANALAPAAVRWVKPARRFKLSPATVRRLEAYARRHKLPHFSAAIEAASELLVK